MTDKTNWPFDAWLKIAVMQLGLSPRHFWDMSLIDWFVFTKISAPHAMGKEDLTKLEHDYEQSR